MSAVMSFLVLAAETAEEESSKTPFYIGGGLLAAWAVLVSAIGLSRPDFPRTEGTARAIYGVSILLVIGAVATSLSTG